MRFPNKQLQVNLTFSESYDELVLMQLNQYDKKRMTSAEKEFRESEKSGSDAETPSEAAEGSLTQKEQDDLVNWIKTQLGPKASQVKVTAKLESHPCVVTVEEMAAARHFIKTQGANFTEEQRYTA